MKTLLESTTLAGARREMLGLLESAPYRLVSGRRPDGDGYTLCHYAFDTEEDYEAWRKGTPDEHQIPNTCILCDVIKNHAPQYWYGGLMPTGNVAEEVPKKEITEKIQHLYGCSRKTAIWVEDKLRERFSRRTVRINE